MAPKHQRTMIWEVIGMNSIVIQYSKSDVETLAAIAAVCTAFFVILLIVWIVKFVRDVIHDKRELKKENRKLAMNQWLCMYDGQIIAMSALLVLNAWLVSGVVRMFAFAQGMS